VIIGSDADPDPKNKKAVIIFSQLYRGGSVEQGKPNIHQTVVPKLFQYVGPEDHNKRLLTKKISSMYLRELNNNGISFYIIALCP
jgi:hypothetical protein